MAECFGGGGGGGARRAKNVQGTGFKHADFVVTSRFSSRKQYSFAQLKLVEQESQA